MSKSRTLPWFVLLYILVLRLLNYFLKKLGALFLFNLLMQSTNIILSILLHVTSFFCKWNNTCTRCNFVYNKKNVINITCLQFLRASHQYSFVGSVDYRLTEESLKDRLSIDVHEACLQIDKECRWGKNCRIVCLSFTVSLSPFHLHCKNPYIGISEWWRSFGHSYGRCHFTSINLFCFFFLNLNHKNFKFEVFSFKNMLLQSFQIKQNPYQLIMSEILLLLCLYGGWFSKFRMQVCRRDI